MRPMTREAAEAARAGWPEILLAEIETPDGVEHYHSGIGPLEHGGITWTGTGGLASLAGVASEASVSVQQVTASVVVDEALSGLLADDIKALSMRVWIAFLDPHFQIVRDPVLIVDCPLDTATLKMEPGQRIISLVGNAGFYSLEQPPRFLWTNEQQQHDFPGDTGFDRAPTNAKKEVTWKP